MRHRFLHPLVDVAPTIWTQAPTGHLFNYPNKLIGGVEGPEAQSGIVGKPQSPPGGAALLLATIGGIVPAPLLWMQAPFISPSE